MSNSTTAPRTAGAKSPEFGQSAEPSAKPIDAGFDGKSFEDKAKSFSLTPEDLVGLKPDQLAQTVIFQQAMFKDVIDRLTREVEELKNANGPKAVKKQKPAATTPSNKKSPNTSKKTKKSNDKDPFYKRGWVKTTAIIGAVALAGVLTFNALVDRSSNDEERDAALNGGDQTEQVEQTDNDFNFFEHSGVEQDAVVLGDDNESATETETAISPEESIRSHFSEFGDNIAVGDEVDFALNPHESGPNAFRNDTIESLEEYFEWLNSGDAKANAALADVNEYLVSNPEEAERFFSGEGLHFVQFLEDGVIYGNTFYANGEVVQATEGRFVAAGDVWVIYVNESGEIVEELSRRADCANANFTQIVPATPTRTPVTTIDAPVTPTNPTPETPTPETPTPNTPEEPETPDCEDIHGEGAEVCNPPEEEKDPLIQEDATESAAIVTEQAHPAPTPGYDPDNSAEDIVGQQDANDEAIQAGGDTLDPELNIGGSTEGAAPGEESQQTGGANQNPDLMPGSDAPANPQSDGTAPSQGSNGGVVDSPDAPVATVDVPDAPDVPADNTTPNTPADGGSGLPG